MRNCSLDAALVVGIVFFATLVRSALGFGEALVAVPLLALLMPVEIAAPLAVLVSITVALLIVMQDWRHIHIRSALWLVLPTLVGIPLGLMLLKYVPEAGVKAVLATIIIAFSSYMLLRRSGGELPNDKLAWLFGFGAGVLGGAYGMNGPPLVVYGSLRRWSPQHFRATLQGYFLPASIVGMWGYYLAGLWTASVNRFYLMSLPAVVLAIVLGRILNRRIEPARFLVYVHAFLIVVAGTLLIQAI